MINIIFIDAEDREFRVLAEVGCSLMDVAQDNMIPNILADCGGCLSCGTCRVDVADEWAGVIGVAPTVERMMIEGLESPTTASRLSCQITISEDMDGAVFKLSDEFC